MYSYATKIPAHTHIPYGQVSTLLYYLSTIYIDSKA